MSLLIIYQFVEQSNSSKNNSISEIPNIKKITNVNICAAVSFASCFKDVQITCLNNALVQKENKEN